MVPSCSTSLPFSTHIMPTSYYMGMSENGVYPQQNSHLVGIIISKTIGFFGVHNIFRQSHMYRMIQIAAIAEYSSTIFTPPKRPALLVAARPSCASPPSPQYSPPKWLCRALPSMEPDGTKCTVGHDTLLAKT